MVVKISKYAEKIKGNLVEIVLVYQEILCYYIFIGDIV